MKGGPGGGPNRRLVHGSGAFVYNGRREDLMNADNGPAETAKAPRDEAWQARERYWQASWGGFALGSSRSRSSSPGTAA